MKGGRHRIDRPARVARIVKEKILKGEKVVLRDILLAEGYSKTMATVPANVTERPGFKEEMGNFIERLERHRTKVLHAMEKKNLDEEQYRTLSDAASKLTHDVQLLTGGKTENVGVEEDRRILLGIVAEIKGLKDVHARPVIDGEIEGPAQAVQD